MGKCVETKKPKKVDELIKFLRKGPKTADEIARGLKLKHRTDFYRIYKRYKTYELSLKRAGKLPEEIIKKKRAGRKVYYYLESPYLPDIEMVKAIFKALRNLKYIYSDSLKEDSLLRSKNLLKETAIILGKDYKDKEFRKRFYLGVSWIVDNFNNDVDDTPGLLYDEFPCVFKEEFEIVENSLTKIEKNILESRYQPEDPEKFYEKIEEVKEKINKKFNDILNSIDIGKAKLKKQW